MYVIIQKGFSIFGIGETIEEAKTDAKEWFDDDTNLDNLPGYYCSNYGDICVEKASNLKRHDKEIYEEQVLDLIKTYVRSIQSMKIASFEKQNIFHLNKKIRALRKKVVLLLSMLD